MTIRDLIHYDIKIKELKFDWSSNNYGYYFQKPNTEFPRLVFKKYVDEWKHKVELRDPIKFAIDALYKDICGSVGLPPSIFSGISFGPATTPHIENNFYKFNYGKFS